MYCKSSDFNLTKEYSPSENTKRFLLSPDPYIKVLDNFIKTTTIETQRVREKYNVCENVRYGSDNQLLDIYYKEQEFDTPIFAFIHGGYWQALNKDSSGSFVAPLVEHGYRVVVVDYNLCPSVNLKKLTEEIFNFYNWLFTYAKETNASKIHICGHSAGAHLASLLFNSEITNLEKIPCKASFFLISGVYDLSELWKLECTNPNNILSLNEIEAKQLSPLCWEEGEDKLKKIVKFCTARNIKIHILVAANDSETFINQSEQYAMKLNQTGLEVRFKIFENYDHFDIIEEAANFDSAITRYILKNL